MGAGGSIASDWQDDVFCCHSCSIRFMVGLVGTIPRQTSCIFITQFRRHPSWLYLYSWTTHSAKSRGRLAARAATPPQSLKTWARSTLARARAAKSHLLAPASEGQGSPRFQSLRGSGQGVCRA
jgi:hypothetical protein